MSYLAYVAAAYAVFAVVMAWDFLAPRRSIRHQLRALRLRETRRRAVATQPAVTSRELRR